MKQLLQILAIFALINPVLADWLVDPEGSYVGFGSVKNDLIAENHSFTKLHGSVSDAGIAQIQIELASVETLIPIRNERLQALLFEVAQHPVAMVTTQLDLSKYTTLRVGESKTNTIDLSITLHGTALKKPVLIKVTRSSARSVEVTSLGPIIIHASQFALADGVESLRKIAGLQSIDLMVPVTFDLRLVKDASVKQEPVK
jgi:hypothetical protein